MSESNGALATVEPTRIDTGERGADRVMRLFAAVRPDDIDDVGVLIAEKEAELAGIVREKQAEIERLKKIQATCNIITGKTALPEAKPRKKWTRRTPPAASPTSPPPAEDADDDDEEPEVTVPRQPPAPNVVGSGADAMKLHNYKDERDPPTRTTTAAPTRPTEDIDPLKLLESRKKAVRWLFTQNGPQSARNIILKAGVSARYINQVLNFPWFRQVQGGVIVTEQARKEVTAA